MAGGTLADLGWERWGLAGGCELVCLPPCAWLCQRAAKLATFPPLLARPRSAWAARLAAAGPFPRGGCAVGADVLEAEWSAAGLAALHASGAPHGDVRASAALPSTTLTLPSVGPLGGVPKMLAAVTLLYSPRSVYGVR